jgi:ribosomal protein S17E
MAGNLIWGRAYKTRYNKIMNIQNKIVRLMPFKAYLENIEAIFKELHILDIFEINNYLTALFMFRYHHHKNLPEYFTNYFLTNNQIHQRNTRNASKLFKPNKITNYVKHIVSNKLRCVNAGV